MSPFDVVLARLRWSFSGSFGGLFLFCRGASAFREQLAHLQFGRFRYRNLHARSIFIPFEINFANLLPGRLSVRCKSSTYAENAGMHSRRFCMRRPILRLGDKTTSGGSVLEGIDKCTHRGIPKTFIGAKIWCPACNSVGVIGGRGPHRSATMMGKQQALDGDICICKCDPPPICLASQDSAFHAFDSHELAGTEFTTHSTPSASSVCNAYDEQFALKDATGKRLSDTYYTVRLPSGGLMHGITDSQGRTCRYPTDSAERVAVYLGHREST